MGTAWSHNLDHLSKDFAALDVLPEGVDSLLEGLCCSGGWSLFYSGCTAVLLGRADIPAYALIIRFENKIGCMLNIIS